MATQIEKEQPLLPVELLVNGAKVSARPGQTILEVVREQGLDQIPTLCHDPRLEPYGSCFLCVVEVKGSPRLLPACVTRIRDGMEVTTRNRRITDARRTALELLLSDHYADCVCPARLACPAGVDIQGYLSLARLGYYSEALALIRERNPLPVVCGRVCVRKCEVKCQRNHVDEPVGINFVKRFVSEHAIEKAEKPREIVTGGKRAAVVGGGPAGLTCAYYLARRGHNVTIYEALPKLGGMLRYGIPEYRLPRAELDREIQGILDLGVRVNTGRALGRDFTIQSLRQNDRFDAVFVALGAPRGKKMGVKGEDQVEGVQSALEFLRDVELRGHPTLRGRVAVVGGGNSAIDAARTALRCGAAEVTLLYRRTRKEMPAHHEEVDAAEKEGVKIELLVAPLEVIAEHGRLKTIRCQRMELGEPDAGGRRKPVPIAGSAADYGCDYLLAAIGQDTDLSVLQGEPPGTRPGLTRRATIEADYDTMATEVEGVFAGGDVVIGPSAVIDAIAHGRLAAEAIHRYLESGKAEGPRRPFSSARAAFGPIPGWIFDEVKRSSRTAMPERPPGERIRDFAQVETGLAEPDMSRETTRCLECGCRSVFECDLRRYASEYEVDISRHAGEVRRHRIDRSHPLITIDPNKCILCGRCIRTCAEIVGLSVFGYVGRGFATVVRPALGRPLAESACIACGACVESCPTGAIEAELPRGRQGPWKAARVPSICNFCSLGCAPVLEVVSNGLLWATESDSAAPGMGQLCMKGRFGTAFIHDPDRLRAPMIRKDGALAEASWDEAVETAAKTLLHAAEVHGRGSVAVTAAQRLTVEEAMLLRHIAFEGLGTREVGSFGQNRRGGPRRDLDDIFGETASTCSRADIDRADVIFLAGSDPSATHPVLSMSIRRAARRGKSIVSLSSSPVDLLRSGDLWLDARRGTAAVTLASVLKLLFDSGRIGGNGHLKKLEESVAPAVLEEAARLSGVDPARIEALAETLAGTKRVVTIYDLDDTLERSVDDLRALAQLLFLTGHIGQEGEGILLLRSDCNSEGARLAGIASSLHPEAVRGALVVGENPLGDFQSGGMAGCGGHLVVIDHFLTETVRAANVVLPAATLAETDGTVVSFDGKVGCLRRAVQPLSGLTTLEVLAKLSAALGRPVPSEDPASIRGEFAALLGIGRLEFEKARDLGQNIPSLRPRSISAQTLRLDSTASMGNHFPYTTLDAMFERKLADLGVSKP